MLDADVYRFILHMSFEYSCLIVTSFVFCNTVQWLWNFVWTSLKSNWWSCVISLVQLPSILMRGISWTFWHWPMRLVCVCASKSTLLWVIWSRTYYLRSWIEFNEGIKSFDSSSSIETILRLYRYLRFKIWLIFRSRSHFILLLIWWKLNKC